ncbi:AMSH-like ubiquitin thioesterase 3 [Impatiens glandulifera]|uniref:AMSH-like ubiquitin thioesterase 3 n=1 Tax=Impatiens glandulifera TaxID=253017 RepID=UPI001FB0701E|nr:AMSH-like ubiquitin thioesterase 3 [Impatiens glandulifera]
MRPPPEKPINVNAITKKIDVDNRIPIRNYYRIADNLLKQASIYREEKNIVDLYVILLRYVSLVTETIPLHRDYQTLFTKDRTFNKKKAFAVMDELESLKPKFQRLMNEPNKAHDRDVQYRVGAPARKLSPSETSIRCHQSGHKQVKILQLFKIYIDRWPIFYRISCFGCLSVSFHLQLQSGQITPSLHKQNTGQTQVLQPSTLDIQFQKLSINMPKQETLSRHSFLGPNGFRGQWLAPRPEIKVQYPSYSDFASSDNLGLIQTEEYEIAAAKDNISKLDLSPMESVLSLDDGEWHKPSSVNIEANNGHLPLGIIRQPSPPPVLAQVQPEYHPISPSRVADPRPGPAKAHQDGMASSSSNSYQNLHIPVKMMDDFLRLARQNTEKNLETCGVLAGSLKNRVFHITTLIIPKQESTSDSCQTLNEEDIFDVQDKLSLFPLGWIHTHPTQTCFMSSVDLHTHYSYQIMLPEAIAIVMAPTDTSSPHGIFHLSDPGGVSAIRNCQQRGFHPHEELDDGSPIYEHCSHVFINENMRFDVIDLRRD